MESITGAWAATVTVTVVNPLSLPAALVTVSEMVLEPTELKVAAYTTPSPLETAPPPHE